MDKKTHKKFDEDMEKLLAKISEKSMEKFFRKMAEKFIEENRENYGTMFQADDYDISMVADMFADQMYNVLSVGINPQFVASMIDNNH